MIIQQMICATDVKRLVISRLSARILLRLAAIRHCDDRLVISGSYGNIRLFQGIYACFRECTLVSGFACFTRISDVVCVFCD